MIHALPPDPSPIVGRASVIDGDTIEIHGQRIRLWGIDAPEGRRTCTRGGEAYRCGTESARALDRMIADRPVICTPKGRPDRYRRIVAQCIVQTVDWPGRAGPDIASLMVAQGHVVDFPHYSSGAYSGQQRLAQRDRAGMWAGEFQMSWEWRGR